MEPETNDLKLTVALLAEGVDRNLVVIKPLVSESVALLAEGVDRNRSNATGTLDSWVALLAEGVDRNFVQHHFCCRVRGRPPRGGRG